MYVPTAITFTRNICDYLKYEMKLFFPVDKSGIMKHFVKSCPVKKGKYYVRNFPGNMITANSIPSWKIKLYCDVKLRQVIGFNLTMIISVEDAVE